MHPGQKLFEWVVLTARSFQTDRLTEKTQPVFSLGQPIDLAVRFALRELPAKCRSRTQLSLGYHAIPLPRMGIHPDA